MADALDSLFDGPVKECSRCKTTKSLDLFSVQKRGLHGRMSICKDCDSERNRVRRAPLAMANAAKRKQAEDALNPIIDGVPHKTCLGCEQALPLEQFNTRVGGTKPRSQCKKCTSTATGARDKKFPIVDGIQCRICTKCGATKSIELFGTNAALKFGIQPRCKKCQYESYRASYDTTKTIKLGKARAHRKDNPEQYRIADSERNARRRKDPSQALGLKIRTHVRHGLVYGTKKGRKTFDLLGYTVDDLKCHLERQFSDGMSWSNYGRGGWHVDHILPLSSFSYETPDCPDFRAAWAITNLRPLWEADNISKGSKILYLL